ncbi:MAG: hypothetical protein Q9162_000385 [Coniocarpon cinnabarinum]
MIPSIGDILAISGLIGKIAHALDDCRGSARDVDQLQEQLHVLKDVLNEVDELTRRGNASSVSLALRTALARVIIDCHALATPFLELVQKYQKYTHEGGFGNSVKDAARKLQWKLLEAKDVEKFRTQMIAQTSSLQTLVGLWTIQFLVDVQFINTWEAFDAIMEVKFRGQHGHRKIIDKEFALSETGNNREIRRERPWDGVIKPKQQIDMTMLFIDVDIRLNPQGRCPACDKVSTEGKDFVACECGMLYSSMTEIVSEECTRVAESSSGIALGPQLSNALTPSVSKNDNISLAHMRPDMPSDFVRVRLHYWVEPAAVTDAPQHCQSQQLHQYTPRVLPTRCQMVCASLRNSARTGVKISKEIHKFSHNPVCADDFVSRLAFQLNLMALSLNNVAETLEDPHVLYDPSALEAIDQLSSDTDRVLPLILDILIYGSKSCKSGWMRDFERKAGQVILSQLDIVQTKLQVLVHIDKLLHTGVSAFTIDATAKMYEDELVIWDSVPAEVGQAHVRAHICSKLRKRMRDEICEVDLRSESVS